MSINRRSSLKRGFTLVEMLAAATVLVILMGILVAVMNSVSKTVLSASSKIDAFAAARAGFNLLNQKLSQATLNTYWDYDNPLDPTVYRRQSDLQFLILANSQNPNRGQEVYFPSPQSYSDDASLRATSGLLNACAFFVKYGSDQNFRPASELGSPRYRYRLMQALLPTEKFSAYNTSPPASNDKSTLENYWNSYWTAHAWINQISNASTSPYVTPLADNVIALVVWPKLSKADDATGAQLSGNYLYDSKSGQFDTPVQKITANQLPPMIQVTMVMISEASAARLNMQSTPPAEIENALQNKFTDVLKYKDDLETLGRELAAKHIEYNIFTSTVPLRESKWSGNSTP